MIKQLEGPEKKTFAISYVDKQEATFLLGLLRHISCSNCVCFYNGCQGGPSLQENAALSDQEYISKQMLGTEGYLCGKLRNIIALSRAEEQDLQNKFEVDFNRKISLLAKKGEEEKFVLIYDKDEFNGIAKTIEKQMVDKIQRDVDQINKHNVALAQGMQERIAAQAGQIKEMQERITVQEQLLSKSKKRFFKNEAT
jgi:hypothetical protein